ncbi:MAG TPA: hypothetical protein VFD27_09700 [Chthoniobacteraceae bacterium]|nr:hypothetical protein [Chthoniobacteraceae bacterium]
MKTLLVLALAIATTLHAQDLAPELESLVTKYKADLAAFNAQKASAMARAQQPYVSTLDGAEKTATSAGSLDAVAAITKEREALKAGPMRAPFPEGLPKALQAPRKAYLDAMARVDADLEPRRKTINAAYLQALASLQAKAAGKPDLATQIAAEKEKLLANAYDESPEGIEKAIETLLTSKEWIHRGQYRYKFTKGGRYQFADKKGRFEIDGNKGVVSLNWDNGARESLQFDKTTRTFTHSGGGDFVPVGK